MQIEVFGNLEYASHWLSELIGAPVEFELLTSTNAEDRYHQLIATCSKYSRDAPSRRSRMTGTGRWRRCGPQRNSKERRSCGAIGALLGRSAEMWADKIARNLPEIGEHCRPGVTF